MKQLSSRQESSPMNIFRRSIFVFGLLCLSLPLAQTSFAQSSQASLTIDPARFPRNTVFYLLWRGAPSADARRANSLYSLWDDPGFAPARNAMLDSFMKDSRKSSDGKPQLTRDEISEFTTLLENPMTLGFVMDPKPASAKPAANSTLAKPENAHKWNGFFFIYDRTGNEALLAKALLRFRSGSKEPPKMTAFAISGLPALKVEYKTETDYWLESGKYVISSGEPSVIEQVIRGLKIPTPPSKSQLISQNDMDAVRDALRKANPANVPASNFLGGVAAYKEASPALNNGAVEIFVNIADAIKLAGDTPGPQGIRPSMVLDSMRMGAVHSFTGRVLLDGAKTRFQVGLLGDTTAGSIYDIWDAGQTKPASIAYISPATASYREAQFNLNGLYALALRVITPFIPKGQAEPANMMEAAAQLKLGMSTSEALNAFTGEFGSLDSGSTFEFGKGIYFIGVRNRDVALKLLRRAFLDNITADEDEAGVTCFTLDMNRPAAGQSANARSKFYLAVTKDIILLSAHRESLKAPLAQNASAAAPAQLAPFFASHNDGHASINGLSFTDWQKFDWNSLKDLPSRNKTAGTSTLLGFAPDKSDPAKSKSWLDEIDPKVFTKHLHLGLGYSWKDANGLHFDGWID